MASQFKLEAGLQLNIAFKVTQEMMAQFGSLSGDFHPIHIDESYAKSRGFSGCIVYGGIIVSLISRLIGMELSIPHCLWTRLTIDFVSPLYINEEAILNARIDGVSEAVQALALRFQVRAAERLIARGKAEVSFSDG